MKHLRELPDDVRERIVEFLLARMGAKDVVLRGARLARALLGPKSLGADGAAYRLVAERLKLERSAELPTWRSVVQMVRAEWLQLSPSERYGTIDERALNAAARLDLALIARACLKAGRNPNGESGISIRWLWWASMLGSRRVVQVLLDAGAKFKGSHDQIVCSRTTRAPSVSGKSVLGVASGHGHVDVVQALLAAGAEVDCLDSYCNTALMYASSFGKPEAIRALVAAGANVNLVNDVGTSALLRASSDNRLSGVEALIAAGADPNVGAGLGGSTPLSVACLLGFFGVVDALLQAGADVNARGRYNETPLMVACRHGAVATVRRLLAADADMTMTRGNALKAASAEGRFEVVQLLLAKAAATAKQGETAAAAAAGSAVDASDALRVAVSRKNKVTARMLCLAGATL